MAAKKKQRKPPPKKGKAPKAAEEAPKLSKRAEGFVPSAKDYVADLRALKGVEKQDFALFRDPLAWTAPPREWISSGLLSLDRLTGGGWPVGKIIEIAGWQSVGKSSLVDQAIAQAQRQGHVAALINTEKDRDESYMTSLGVDLDQIIMAKALTIEDSYLAIDRALSIQEAHVARLKKSGKQPPAMLIVWDALGGTPSRAEYEGAPGDKQVGTAKIIRGNFRRIVQRIADARASLIYTNHFYQGIGPFAKLTASGGGGVLYYPALRIYMSKIETLKIGDAHVGHVVKAKLEKTKLSAPRAPVEVALLYGAGFHNAWTLYEWGQRHGDGTPGHHWISQAGQFSYLHGAPADFVAPGEGGAVPGEKDGKGYVGFRGSYLGLAQVLAQQPTMYAKLADAYLRDANG